MHLEIKGNILTHKKSKNEKIFHGNAARNFWSYRL